MVALYTVTIFVSAALLFLVQPMFARQVLPLLGGSPAVWNTAMVFYQAVLLAGYGYAHAASTRLGVRQHARWHLALLLLPFLVLPIGVPSGWVPPTETTPVPWLLALMVIAVGLPFFVVSATSPLLQRWFAFAEPARAENPYSLYAASNAGSILALLSYPLWLERHFSLAQQSRIWTGGYALLVGLVALCVIRVSLSAPAVSVPGAESVQALVDRPTTRRRLRWVLLAFVPSSLLLGVTTYLSSEIAVVPLLWVVPLALYLLTFVIAFAQHQVVSRRLVARSFPILVIALVLVFDMLVTRPIGGLIALHLAVFFAGALLCHFELAATRPPVAHLTEFYLWLSLGGVLGGAFNALLGPLLFNSVAEYPLALVLACAVALPPPADRNQDSVTMGRRLRRHGFGDVLWPLLLGAGTLGVALFVRGTAAGADTRVLGLVFGAAALICYFFSQRRARFALGVGALLLAGFLLPGGEGRVLAAQRSFFGIHSVALDPVGGYHELRHGVTVHGRQSLDPARRREALSYYHRTGPIGDVFERYASAANAHIGVVGLGAGSLASYARAGQSWSYFEIDPVVVAFARDPGYFTFLRDSATEVRIVIGDARRTLAMESDQHFDLLVLDAYSSDAIPVHLVTREALAMYLRKLAPGGRLAFHISNVHLDLEPVFANLAADAAMVCRTGDDTTLTAEELALGKAPSVWVVMARSAGDLESLARNPRWRPGRTDERQPVWTDNYSSLLSVLRWR
jgi:SAM-dependent methyltransferase